MEAIGLSSRAGPYSLWKVIRKSMEDNSVLHDYMYYGRILLRATKLRGNLCLQERN